MINNKFLPEDFNLEEWKLFKKYNNRLEKQSRHIDAWFVDEPSLSEEELKKRLAYNKEHLIKDTLEQIAKGLLVEETPESTGAPCGGQCEPTPQSVKQESAKPQVQEQPVVKAEPEVISYKPIEEIEQKPQLRPQDQPMPSVMQPIEQQPPERSKVFEAPQNEQARPPMSMPENEELKLLQDVSSKLDRLIDLAEKIVTQKSKSKRQD